MTPIRVLLVDDEPLARQRLRQMLADHADVSIAGEAEDVDQARELVRSERPDLILLDIRMPGADGFALVEGLHLTPMPYIIFVTAYGEHAVEAFDAEAVDYLLKPFDRERFARAMSRARRFLAGDQLAAFRAKVASVLHTMGPGARPVGTGAESLNGSAGSGPNAASNRHPERARGGDSRLVIRTRGRITFVSVGDIEWIETSRNYVRVRAKGVWHTMREPLSTFASRVDPLQFVRVSRSCVVNLDRVREFRRQANGQYTVLLDDGQRLVASRRYGARLAPSGEDDVGDDA